jgi:hypothetical protein
MQINYENTSQLLVIPNKNFYLYQNARVVVCISLLVV